MKEIILNKLNEGRESDATKFTWENTPISLKIFWIDYLTLK